MGLIYDLHMTHTRSEKAPKSPIPIPQKTVIR